MSPCVLGVLVLVRPRGGVRESAIAAFYWSSRRVVVVVAIIMVASIERARSRVKLCTTMREREGLL